MVGKEIIIIIIKTERLREEEGSNQTHGKLDRRSRERIYSKPRTELKIDPPINLPDYLYSTAPTKP